MLDSIFGMVGKLADLAGTLVGQYSDPEKVRQRKIEDLKRQIKNKSQEVRDLYAKLEDVHNSVQWVSSVERLPKADAPPTPNFPASMPATSSSPAETKPTGGSPDTGPKGTT